MCQLFLTREMKGPSWRRPVTSCFLMLAALANPHRLRIVAALTADGRNYVSQLAREVGISRPLLHLHLQKLEEAGLVTSKLETVG